MNVSVESYWKMSLRLKLREHSGDAFQDFVSTILEKRYKGDFVRVRPFGTKGDKGCDGYLRSTGQVIQCYGAVNGDGSKVDYLVDKMDEDFEKAKAHLGTIMKGWSLAHNLVDGLPIHAVLKLADIQTANPKIELSFLALESLDEIVSQLSPEDRELIFGPVATIEDEMNLQIADLKDLVDSILQGIDSSNSSDELIEPVSVDKILVNQLPSYWIHILTAGWKNAFLVEKYFNSHPNPLVGQNVASVFNGKYRYFKAQKLSSGLILDELYNYILGGAPGSIGRQIAGQALLAHLFESCDIFENATVPVS